MSQTTPLLVDAAEVRLLELPLVEPFVASHGTTTVRTLTVVKVLSGQRSGWGECSALPAATYTSESASDSFDVLSTSLVPEIIGSDASTFDVSPSTDRPMANAAIEMALLDLELKTAERSLAQHLGVAPTSIPAGVSIGLDQVDATAHKVARFAQAGFGRVKLKIQPGHDAQLLVAVRKLCPTIDIQVDANGSYQGDHVQHLSELATSFDLQAIEQPFAPSDLSSASQLVARVSPAGTYVVADEAAESVEDVRRLFKHSALTAVSIKPARLGGVLAAVAVHDVCKELGLAATGGGMLESGLGRHCLAALAALPHFSLTGDVSPARRWVTTDPWPDLVLADGRIAVPSDPGVAPAPDGAVLEQLTVRHEIIG